MIGLFKYLNAYPYRCLLEQSGYPYRLFDTPKALAEAWHAGGLGAALMPIRRISQPHYMTSWGIASTGPVQSVLLLSDELPEKWEGIVVDAASTASVALLSWLMGKGYIRQLPLLERASRPSVGRLFIGDSALRWQAFYTYHVDVGALLYRYESQPFPYAVWCAQGLWRYRIERLWREPWPLHSWAEEAGMSYQVPATKVYMYWQGMQYRLDRRAVRSWWGRLQGSLIQETSLPLKHAKSK